MRNLSNAFNGQIHGALSTLLNSTAGPDCGLYGRLFQLFSDLLLPLQAKQLHARVVLFSVTPSNFLGSKLITLYGKSNRVGDARHVFDQIPQKNTFSYNAMLIAYTLNECYEGALDLFSSLACSGLADVRPNNYSITCLLKSLSSLCFSDVKLGKEVHGFVLRHGYDADVFVENALITHYSRCEDMVSARRVFDRMRERDVVSWNSMISGYSQVGFYTECKELYMKMVGSAGFRPNGVTLISVLQACGQSRDLVLGMEAHKFLVDNRIEMDISVCNALIGLYAKCGSLEYARVLFEDMSEKDEVTYGAIISGYMLHGFVDESVVLFREMKTRGVSAWNALISGLVQNNRYEGVLDLVREMLAFGYRPNAVTLSCILTTLSYFSSLKGAKEIHAFAVKNCYDKNIYVSTSVIDAYSKSGYLSGAQRVFNQSKTMSLIIWTAMISAYAAHGDANSSLCLFDEMLNERIQPDAVTFTALLTACAHSGMVDKALELFDSIYMKHGILPSMEHYACLVGVLSRAGKLSDAAKFVSKMPIEPSAKVWGALLNGAAVSGDVELGEFVCKHLFEIEPENTGNYIIMSNLYSQAGRWKEADIVRARMNQVGIKKIPGSSWIETNRGFRRFFASSSIEDTREILITLEGLLGLISEEGNDLQVGVDEGSVYC